MKQSKARELRQLIYQREVHPDSATKKLAQEGIDTLKPNAKEGRRAFRLAYRKAQKVKTRLERAEVTDAR